MVGTVRIMITIRKAGVDDIPALEDLYHHIGKKDDGYFAQALERSDIYVYEEDENICAFCLYNRTPRYGFYKKLGIPEIQDLNVRPACRRRGIATALIVYCEDTAQQEGRDHIGISVGLTKDYGPAQILYAKMGYIPDGNGVTYDRDYVTQQRSYRIDDDMALMLVKSLSA